MERYRQRLIHFPLPFLLFGFFSLCIPFSSSAAEPAQAKQGSGLTLPQACSLKLLGNKDYFPALQKAIEGAREEIILSFYLFKTDGQADSYPVTIAGSLVRAAARGIKVEVLLERSEDRTDQVNLHNHETGEKLTGGGISVYFDSPHAITHTKLVVIDRRYTFIGSHNLTQAALKYNNEFSVLIDSADVAAQVLNYVRRLH